VTYMLLTKKLIHRLSEPYIEGQMTAGYVESQSMDSISSKAILLVNDTTLMVLFLNFFQTKVIHQMVFSRKEIENEQLKEGITGLDVVWRFTIKDKKWRFRIVKNILTLGKMQQQFIEEIRNS
jgi:heme/copper-type cytochrome/quinol oxidase subunit 2